ncbi:MAG: caspase family protein [Anaeromyxobacter sp.]
MTGRAAALLVLCALAAGPARAAAPPARFAVVVGANGGAAGRARLWFAESDADRFGRALVELGDFAPARVKVLRAPTLAQLRQALADTEAAVAEARRQSAHPLLVVYFSGHADAGGIELGDERLPFDELRRLVNGSSAEARIGVVDACEAGLLTQVKGASPAPALDFAIPADDQVRGTAFVASTAVGEPAQESAAIGGSFFTHHLEAGLRGAADADGDGQVTLGEAFRYTAAQTLAGTLSTKGGAQHATYDFRMSGRGDVILSDLRRAEARLTVPRDPGVSYVLRGPQKALIEVSAGERPVVLALPAGVWRVERRAPEGRATAEVRLERGADLPIPALAPTRYELARAKGGPRPGLIFAGGGAGTFGLPGFGAAPVARIGLRKELGPVGLRLRLDWMGKSTTDPVLGPYSLSYVGGGLAALVPVNTARVLIEAGPEISYGYATQQLDVSGKGFGASVLGAGGAVMVTAPVGPLRLGLDVNAGVQAFRLDDALTVKPAFSAAVLALWGF